ncbi:MAG: MFS transporter [Lachnospiraceae bacterium]|nr:MFS transporter [Lachnospiraceae bacterium]
MEENQEKGTSFFHLLMISTFIYVATALYTPFMSMYYTQHGISSTEIGILGLFSCLSALVIQPLWAKRADDTGKAKTYAVIILIGVILALQTYYLGNSFWNFALSAFLLAIFSTSIVPMLDAIVIRNADKKRYNYAYIRLGGTIGFAIVVLVVGRFLKLKPALSFALAGGAYLILLIIVLLLPRSENHLPKPEGIARKIDFLAIFRLKEIFKDPAIIYIFIFAFLVTLGLYFNMFLPVYAANLGMGQDAIGIIQCVSALSEVPVLLIIRKMTKKLGALRVVALAGMLSGVKLFIASFGSMPMFIISAAMNGVTYMTMYFASTQFIYRTIRKGRDSEGQSAFCLVQTGLGAILGSTVGGVIIDLIGVRESYILFSAIVFFASLALAIPVFIRIRQGKLTAN